MQNTGLRADIGAYTPKNDIIPPQNAAAKIKEKNHA